MSRLRSVLLASTLFTLSASAQGMQGGPRPSPTEIKQAVALALAPGVPPKPVLCLKEYVDWCKQTTAKKWCYLTYTLSQVNGGGKVAYSEGALAYNAAKGILEHAGPIGYLWYENESRYPTTEPFRPAVTKAVLDLNPANCTASLKVGGLPFVTTPQLQVNGGIVYAFDTAKGCATLITLKKASLDVAP